MEYSNVDEVEVACLKELTKAEVLDFYSVSYVYTQCN